MKTILLIPFFCSCLFSNAQINPTENSNKYSDPQNMDVIYTAEAKCVYPEKEMYDIIYKGITYSEDAKKSNINDKVMVSFDVNFDNNLQDFTVVHGVGFGIDEQIVTAIKTLKFEAAIMNGIKVRQNVILTIPVKTYPEM